MGGVFKRVGVHDKLKLGDGSRIAVVGAGPAGAFFAHFALEIAAQLDIRIEVTLFDGKDFIRSGPPGCNLCAGVISETLHRKMAEAGIRIPEERVQHRILGYQLVTIAGDMTVTHPHSEKRIVTVFRGNGPRFSESAENVSFDDFLLEHSREMGAKVVRSRVKDIVLPSDSRESITLFYEASPSNDSDDSSDAAGNHAGEGSGKYQADQVVGAFGVNTVMMNKIAQLGFGYKPPETIRAAMAEIPLGEEYIRQKFGDLIWTFTPRLKHIRFVAMIPKVDHATLTIVGRRDLTMDDIAEIIDHPVMRRMIPPDKRSLKDYCICFPRIVTRSAEQPYGDRIVMLGDSSFSRYYKNGIESAFVTAKLATEAAFRRGVSKRDFEIGYLKPARKSIVLDNTFGRLLYRMHDFVGTHPLFSRTFHSLSTDSSDPFCSQRLKDILWNMQTGNRPYREIFWQGLHPLLQMRLAARSLRLLEQGIRRRRKVGPAPAKTARVSLPRTRSSMGPLRDGQRVVIVGGGPGGAGCAIALKNIAKERNIDLDVLVYEGKDFSGHAHYNQCLGVLSPPIKEIMCDKLGIPFPDQLVQRLITGYCLHSDNNQIELMEKTGPSYAVRRVTFDDYLLNQAREAGARVVTSRVTDMQIRRGGVMVFSESDNVRADVVVGAFGLDYGTSRIFEIATRYRQPKFLNSVVTKIHPTEESMENFGNNIHAFLPSLMGIEFGAITPKQNHLSINIAGARVTAEWMNRFLALPFVRKVLPPEAEEAMGSLNYYMGRFPIGPAKGIFGDRYVTIGDASGLLRSFKGKGVNTGMVTGHLAAQCIMNVGVSAGDFLHYYQSCGEVTRDLFYGNALRVMLILSSTAGLVNEMIELAKNNETLKKALYDCVSGHRMYKDIFDESKNLMRDRRMIDYVCRSLWRYTFNRSDISADL